MSSTHASKWLQIVAISDDAPGIARSVFSGSIYAGVPVVQSVADFVKSVAAICRSQGPGALIGRLVIVAHADSTCVAIGNDILNLSSFRQFQNSLAGLRQFLDAKLSSQFVHTKAFNTL